MSLQSSITYTRDAGDRVTKAVDSLAGTINRTYDGLNDLTQEVTPQGTINYTYDNASRRATLQAVGQSQVGYTWDNANRLTAISQGSQSVGLNYDNANRRTCLTLPNGVLASYGYGYDKDSRVTSITYGTGGSCSSPPSNLGNLTYTYDSDGRRTATAGSLAAVTLPANVTGGASSTVYNADNAQTKFNGTALNYDANGNLTTDGTNTYTWDARNHLTAISGGSAATFTYDGFGRRVKKVIGGTTTQFLYDGLNPVQELNGKHNAAAIANLLTGLGVDEYFTRTDTATGVTSTLLADALGSTIGLVTANNGPIATNYTYQPFGAATTGGSANGNSYQFTGRENDSTGLYFYRARYYSPTFQRFVSQDPSGFGPGDANLYGYVRQRPSYKIDPFGLQEDEKDPEEGTVENSLAFQNIFKGKIPVIPEGGLDLKLDNGMIIPIMPGTECKPADNGKGVNFRWGDKTVRVMGPTTGGKYEYKNGYVRVYNQAGNPIDLTTGKPGPDPITHYGLLP